MVTPDDATNADGAWRAGGGGVVQRSRDVVILAALTGAVTAVVVAAFEHAVHLAQDAVGTLPLAVVAALPAVGLTTAAVLLRTAGRGIGPGTADEYLRAYHEPGYRLRGRDAVVRLAASVCTLGSGCPMGLEGPSLYAGATVGAQLQHRLPRPFRHADGRTLLVAGAAAGVAAVFKAPATGVVFAMEVPFRDDLARRTLLPCLVAAASGYLTFVALAGTEPLFAIGGSPEFVLADLAVAVALGAAAGIGARVFAGLIRVAKRLVTRPLLQRLPAAVALLIGLFVLTERLTGEPLAYGSGIGVFDWLAGPDGADAAAGVLVVVLAVRCLGTAATVAAGGVGGVFVPLAVGGALTGHLIGDLVPAADPGLCSVLGVAAFLGAGYRVPLASVMFVAETTGRPGFVVPALLAAVAAELAMGRASVTPYQRDPS